MTNATMSRTTLDAFMHYLATGEDPHTGASPRTSRER